MRTPKSALVICPDPTESRRIERVLRNNFGLRVLAVPTGQDGIAALSCRRFALVISAAAPSDADVAEIVRLGRLRDCACRFILIHDPAADAATAPANPRIVEIPGAPINLAVLQSAVARSFGKSAAPETKTTSDENRPFDFERREIRLKAGDKIELTPREALLIDYLRSANGAPVTRRELLREVWGYADVAETHTLETHVYRLRKKMAVTGAPFRLVTSEGGGYQLVS